MIELTQTSVASAEHGSADAAARRLAGLGLGLLVLAAWMLEHPYRGLVHDSTTYSLVALARIHPDSLGGDLFLRYGSQDQYTIFTPVYAGAVRLLGLEPAAAVLTLLVQIAFFAAAGCLARRLMPTRQAFLAVGLLVALSCTYGADRIFSATEEFLTPRMLSEAFVLLGLLAALSDRFWVATACIVCAAVLHPIMAAAGIFLLFCLYLGARNPRLAVICVVAATVGIILVSFTISVAPLARFDPAWQHVLDDRFRFLFPSRWLSQDWGRLSVPCSVLVIGWVTHSEPLVRKICTAALITAVAGLVLTLLLSDTLHIQIATQMQMWRWAWLSNVLAVLMLPVIVAPKWAAGGAHRASCLLLAAAWICIEEPFALAVSTLATGCAWGASRVKARETQRMILLGSVGVLVITLLMFVGSVATEPGAWADGSRFVIAALLVLGWWAGERVNPRYAVGLVLLSAGACAAAAPSAYQTWTYTQYPANERAAFASWRARIPPQASVLWPDVPMGAWYLLGRSDYWSVNQGVGSVFNRATALEALRRERVAGPLLAPGQQADHNSHASGTALTRVGLQMSCRSSDLEYVATWIDLGPTPFPAIAPVQGHPERLMRLYSCVDLRD